MANPSPQLPLRPNLTVVRWQSVLTQQGFLAKYRKKSNNESLILVLIMCMMYVLFFSIIESTGHLIKGCLGGGVLGIHEAYMKTGLWSALAANIFFGVYISYCVHVSFDFIYFSK